ncbi:hypothetical protein EIN_093420 [Entamoeba invadens IP1]|uniref:Uncharacterized protein n=1 Tax=Entamoeba invadens IP1 TaxID=370355 RepID=A0A0A1TZV9_ENTIV|nr:hypothetical protein EIN_093420 [Entamoeba invadens IP1]ELP87185.1 hypothetical protein EIN_093420 [Entamoeba invadens IP1]|eukprot:XP_004253956.1 hypothetical protein EIN_093420 [Entamoeba invadens IP1]
MAYLQNVIALSQVIPCPCELCRRGFRANQKMTWNLLLRVIFTSLHSLDPTKEYFSLVNDIYTFVHSHYAFFFHLKQFQHRESVWKKAMVDALSHSKTFKTGFPVFGLNGFWKMVEHNNPWTSEEVKEEKNESAIDMKFIHNAEELQRQKIQRNGTSPSLINMCYPLLHPTSTPFRTSATQHLNLQLTKEEIPLLNQILLNNAKRTTLQNNEIEMKKEDKSESKTKKECDDISSSFVVKLSHCDEVGDDDNQGFNTFYNEQNN